MLDRNQTFPQTFNIAAGSGLKAIVQGVIQGKSTADVFYGITRCAYSDYPCLWDSQGNCLIVTPNDTVSSRNNRKLVPIKAPGQENYEKLDADGKSILALFYRTIIHTQRQPLVQAYLREKLNVNSTEAHEIFAYAINKDFK